MVSFKIKKYTENGDFMLVREMVKEPSPGLPPTHSQVILMNECEINDLMKVLQDYANEGRNTGV